MSIQELQAILRDHAAAISDDGLVERASSSMRRARATRRRQGLAAVAAAAVFGPLVGAAIIGGNPLHRSAPPVHHPERTPSVKAAFAGRELVASEVVQDKGELVLTRTTDVPTQWTVTCYGVGPDFTVHATLDGGSAAAAPCETLEPPEAQFGYVVDRSRPTGSHTVRVWLTRTGSVQIATVPDSVVAAGVYQLPDPVAVVAGADVYPREFAYGTEWQYAASLASEPGERRLVAERQQDSRLLAQLVLTDVSAASVRLVVDGVETDAAEVLDGSGFLPVLPAGRHAVELRIAGDAPPTAQLGVIWRTASP